LLIRQWFAFWLNYTFFVIENCTNLLTYIFHSALLP
jgi:hypothetical protein